MHDVADVRAIDAHAERHRRNDDVHALLEKRFLMPAADLAGQAGMIGRGGVPLLRQPRGERLDLAARSTVDDARFAVVPREYLQQLPVQDGAAQDSIGEVRPIE